ncbi:MAG: isoprenylcysteine carboxylmethyltransferase family protein [Actinomycetota bacterium]
MTERRIGWAFVAVQIVLLVGLVVMPSADHYPTPGWLDVMVTIVFWLGVAVAILGGVALGRALTATPVPNHAATLRTRGPYRNVRHPIYTGVILIVIALAVGSGNVAGLALGAATIGFFHVKASWEEDRLAERFPEYERYAAMTPRFVPRVAPRAVPSVRR